MHTPTEHGFELVSLQEAPSFLGVFWHCPPMQKASKQVLSCPTSHDSPSAFGSGLQPICESQTPTEQRSSKMVQSLSRPPPHTPLSQVVPVRQISSLGHWNPLLPGLVEQLLVASSQVPIWQVSAPGHTFAVPLVQVP